MPGSMWGTEVRRVEDPDLLLGRSTFVANHQEPGLLHAVFVRSPVPHARLAGIETTEALAAPGVVAVLTAADLGERPFPPFAAVNPALERRPLASDGSPPHRWRATRCAPSRGSWRPTAAGRRA